MIKTGNGSMFVMQTNTLSNFENPEVRLVDFKKSGPGARAKADALANSNRPASKSSSGSNGNRNSIFVYGFDTHGNFCIYNRGHKLVLQKVKHIGQSINQEMENQVPYR